MTMRYVAFFICALLALAFLSPTAAAQIRLNEILADPASDWDSDGTVNSKLDEWVEIVNVGGTTVDLSRFRLTDESGGTDWRFVLGGTLAPGAVRLVTGAEVSAWQTANGVGNFGLSLNNGGDTVYLYEVVGSDTLVADSQAYGSVEVADDRAVGRQPSGTGAWVLFDGLNPYSGSTYVATGCRPSPGAVIECTTPVETSSWGAVKNLYED
jgi:hypothetical protein